MPDPRCAGALTDPLTSPTDDITHLRRIDPTPDGHLLVSILAVDR